MLYMWNLYNVINQHYPNLKKEKMFYDLKIHINKMNTYKIGSHTNNPFYFIWELVEPTESFWVFSV